MSDWLLLCWGVDQILDASGGKRVGDGVSGEKGLRLRWDGQVGSREGVGVPERNERGKDRIGSQEN